MNDQYEIESLVLAMIETIFNLLEPIEILVCKKKLVLTHLKINKLLTNYI